MALTTNEATEIGNMPEDLIRENAGLLLSIVTFAYGLLAGAVGWMSKRLSKLRDHDEDIRRLTTMQSDTAEILTCMRAEHAKEVHERREEDGRIYARMEANAVRYDDKVDQIKNSMHELGLKVERAIRGE